MSEYSYPSAGFPDYSRFNPQGGRLIDTLTGALSGSPSTGPISTTGFGFLECITVGAVSGTNGYQVTFKWSNTPGGPVIAQTQYTPNDADSNIVNMQVLAEWVTVTHQFFRGTGTATPTTYIYGVNVITVGSDIRGLYSSWINFDVVIPLSSNTVLSGGGISPGPATISIGSTSGVTWYYTLDYLNVNTGLPVIFGYGQASTFQPSINAKITLPPAPIRATIYNTSTSASITVFGSLLPD